jgi:DNA-binding NarL/FixJ family response regulator
MTKIAIIDNYSLFRKSLVFLLKSNKGLEIVYDSNNGHDFIECMQKTQVDLVLLDIQLPTLDSFEICMRAKSLNPQIKVLIISHFSNKEILHQTMKCGANGFFSKKSLPESLIKAIYNLNETDYYFDMEVANIMKEAILWDTQNKVQKSINTLTEREIDIIKSSITASSSKEIAARLEINIRTVEKHRSMIMEKTNSKNFIQAVVFAIKNKLINLDDF